MPEFGDSFRSARESRRLTIDQIAQETRISARFLRAIEEEDFRELPGGLFNRGFIRAYAGKVGLDPDEAVARYSAIAPDNGVTPEPTVVEPVETDSAERHIVPIAIGALVVLIAVFYFFFQDRTIETSSGTPPDAAAEAAPPAEDTDDGPGSAARVLAMPPDLVVELDTRNATWIRVRSDGAAVEEMTMQPGMARTFSAERAIDMRIGNAAGITLRINGEPMPDLGAEGQVVSLSITPQNYRALIDPN